MTRSIMRAPGSWWFAGGLAIVGFLAVFKLPFLFPPQQRLVSPSYQFGFNNSVAIIAVGLLLGAATLYRIAVARVRETGGRSRNTIEPASASLVRFPEGPVTPEGRLPLRLFIAMATLYGLGTLALSWYAQHAAGANLTWESRHFLHRIKLYEINGLRPYIDFQAEYGPALMYPPAWLHMMVSPLGVSIEGAYFLCHWLMNLAGLGALFYIVRRMSSPPRSRAIAFLIVGLAGFGPWMGLNGVVLRYACPFASILIGQGMLAHFPTPWGTRRWLAAITLVATLMTANVVISPEIALAFTVGWLTYAVLALRRQWRLLAVSLVAMAATAAVSYYALPAAYYGSLLRFSQGAANLPLLPAAHLLLFLFTLALVVPPLLTAGWRGRLADAPVQGAMGVLCVVMMPGALGRCDPPHVLFYGLVASLFLMVQFSHHSRRAFAIYGGAYALVFIGFMWVVHAAVVFNTYPKNIVLHPFASLRLGISKIQADCAPRDLTYLSGLDKYPELAVPFATNGIDAAAESYLFARGSVAAEYYVATVGIYTEADMARKLADLDKYKYLLVQEGWDTPWDMNPCRDELAIIRKSFLYPANLECKKPSIIPLNELNRHLVSHYRRVEKVGPSVVLERRPAASGATASAGP